MRRYFYTLLLTALPLILLFAYPYVKIQKGMAYGDINKVGTPFFDVAYKNVYEYDPNLGKNVIVTEDFNKEQFNPDSAIFVIGDSYSQLGKASFTNYLADILSEYSVYAVPTKVNPNTEKWNYIYDNDVFPVMTDLVSYLLNIDNIPRTIVIESGECYFIERLLATRFDLDKKKVHTRESQQILQLFRKNVIPMRSRTIGDRIVKGYNKFCDDIEYCHQWTKKLFGVGRAVEHHALTRDVFTAVGHERDLYSLYFHYYQYSNDEVKMGLRVMQRLIDVADRKGVRLIFCVAGDKPDVYREFITADKRLEQVSLFDQMSEIDDNEHYINTKKLLIPYIKAGMKDAYLCNDSHWSYKSAKIVADEIVKRIE